MHENREVWHNGRRVTFHPNKRNPHRGFVYFPKAVQLRGGRLYGTIELIGYSPAGIRWAFTSHRAAQIQAGVPLDAATPA